MVMNITPNEHCNINTLNYSYYNTYNKLKLTYSNIDDHSVRNSLSPSTFFKVILIFIFIFTLSNGMQNLSNKLVNLSLIPSGMNFGNVLSHVLTIRVQCKHCGSMYKTPHLKYKTRKIFKEKCFHGK